MNDIRYFSLLAPNESGNYFILNEAAVNDLSLDYLRSPLKTTV